MADFILTDEMRELMLSHLPFSVDSTIEFTPKFFLKKKTKKNKDGELEETNEYLFPKEIRPVFILKPFSKATVEELNLAQTKIAVKEKDAFDIIEYDLFLKKILARAIVGWKNFYDIGNKKYIEYKKDDNGADLDIVSNFPVEITDEMFFKVSKISGLKTFEKAGL